MRHRLIVSQPFLSFPGASRPGQGQEVCGDVPALELGVCLRARARSHYGLLGITTDDYGLLGITRAYYGLLANFAQIVYTVKCQKLILSDHIRL